MTIIHECDNCGKQNVPGAHHKATYVGDTTQCFVCTQGEFDPYGEMDPPEEFATCMSCCGEGQLEIPEPISKWGDDPDPRRVIRCEDCGGAGGFIVDRNADQRERFEQSSAVGA